MGKTLALIFLALLTGCAGPSMLYEDKGDLSLAPLGGQVVRITSEGIVPSGRILVKRSSGGILFLNETRDRVVSLRFPDRVLSFIGCSPTSRFAVDSTSTFTDEPLSPGAAASLCFHEDAELEFEVHGLKGEVQRGVLVVGGTW